MRTGKELLQLMLENKNRFETGLCYWVITLYSRAIINKNEYELIKYYIKNNRPSMFSSLSAFKNIRSNYYWEKGDITPRIKWINKQIEKL